VDEPETTRAVGARAEGVLRVRGARLVVRGGPDDGRQARLDVPTFVVGSGEDADFRLSDPTVSRQHLRLSLEESGVHLRDEGSTNGTWLGGVRLVDALVTGDTVLTLGESSLALHLDAAPLELPISTTGRFGEAISVSPTMRHVFAMLERAAQTDITVLIEGESGVGKEVLARGVHASSSRAARPFVAVDCGAIAPSVIESELFGHEKGAFTGATHARIGLFEQADGGTLFLDELGELPLDLQPKLLRALEEREIRPLGGTTTRKVDVRVIAATNRRLAEAAKAGSFRADLYYRLAVARVTIPPLRDRREDVVPLARLFLERAVGEPNTLLPDDFAAMLSAYSWPGNVRELRNVIDRYAVFGTRDTLFDIEHEQQPLVEGEDFSSLPFHEARRLALERFERAYIPKVLQRAGGVVSRAAQLAQVARPSFYRMIDRLPREH